MAATFALRPRNQNPEAVIQRQVAAMLRAYLPDDIWFSASLSGVKLSPHMAGQAKASGMQRGAPDLSFVFPDGTTRYVEIKAGKNTFTTEQQALKLVLGDSMELARSCEEVRAILTAWMAPYRLSFLTDGDSVRREGARRVGAA